MHPDSSSNEVRLLNQLRDNAGIFAALQSAAGNEFQIQARLRAEFSEELVRAVLTLRELRKKAQSKFSRADEMWFDRIGLEQSTAETVAVHKSQRFQGRVWDYCSGIGSDAIALGHHCEVTTIDVNPAASLRTRWNAETYGVADSVNVITADVQQLDDTSGLLHIDPDRRVAGNRRSISVEDCIPSLDFLVEATRRFQGGAIKLSPASNFGGKFPGSEIELVSLAGECKEATVWFGELSGDAPFRATVLPAGQTIVGNPMDSFAEVAKPGKYLYDPDPAVVRSGLVDLLCEEIGFWRLDSSEEYLSSDTLIESPFVRGFEIIDELPNNEKEIRRCFRKHSFGQVEIKCRHIPVQAEAIRRKLPLEGDGAGVLIFCRIHGKARAVIARRVKHAEG